MRRAWRWIFGAIALLLVLVVVGSRLVDEPLRRRIESGMNAALKGYKVRIGKVRFHPIGFSLDLMDGVIIQEANPDPPVANVPQLHASVEWLALLHGNLVADFRFDQPALHIDLRHAQAVADHLQGGIPSPAAKALSSGVRPVPALAACRWPTHCR